MPHWIHDLATPPTFVDEEENRVANLLHTLLLSVIAIAAATMLTAPLVPSPELLVFVAGTVILLSVCEILLLRSGHVRLATGIFLSGHWLSFTILMLITGGVTSVFAAGQFTTTLFAGFLLGGYAAATVAGLSIVADVGMVGMNELGILRDPLIPLYPGTVWLGLTITLIGAVVVLYLADRSIKATLRRARITEQAQYEANRDLQAVRESLERQVAERTGDLVARSTQLLDANRRLEASVQTSQKRATLLQASAEVSRAVAQIRELDHLLPQVTRLISKHFGFYHAGVFLIDKASHYAVLRGASSAGGQRMLARQHRLRVGSQGIVGYVTVTGKTRVAMNVGADAVFFNNPELPDTQSEMAIPLRVGAELIGALDVQSTEDAAFTEEDVTVLELLADQITIAIENARLNRESQRALARAQNTSRRYLRKEWDVFLDGRSAGLSTREVESVPSNDRLCQP
jgi:putative methionine-R-sulfoxide reductase with GAF domain